MTISNELLIRIVKAAEDAIPYADGKDMWAAILELANAERLRRAGVCYCKWDHEIGCPIHGEHPSIPAGAIDYALHSKRVEFANAYFDRYRDLSPTIRKQASIALLTEILRKMVLPVVGLSDEPELPRSTEEGAMGGGFDPYRP